MGSAHCVGMCGGIVVTLARTRQQAILYHGGRLLGYLSLGAIAGFLGQRFSVLHPETGSPFAKILYGFSAFLMGAYLIWIGTRVFRGKSLHGLGLGQGRVAMLLAQAWKKVLGNPDGSASALWGGVLTAFLPCGWLQSFLVGAIATQSVWKGAGFLGLFWLGTVPAMSAATWLFRTSLTRVFSRMPRVAGAVLIGVGVLSLVHRASLIPRFTQGEWSGSAQAAPISHSELEKTDAPQNKMSCH